jgi:hypothetical protein
MNRNDVRAGILKHVSSMLMGPVDTAEVLESPPADTYLTGILWPRGAALSAQEDDAGDVRISKGSESGEAGEAAVPGYRVMRPCSAGITFAADATAAITVSLGSTARYVCESAVSPAAEAEQSGQGRDSLRWRRVPLALEFSIAPSETRMSWTETFSGSATAGHMAEVHVKRRPGSGQNVFTLTLINPLPEEKDETLTRDERCLFQAGLAITAANPDGSPAIRPRRQVAPSGDDADALSNALLYRNEHEYAVGHGIGTGWSAPADSAVHTVYTSWLPESVVAGTSPDGSKRLAEVTARYPGLLKAPWLAATGNRNEVLDALSEFCACYGGWIRDELEARLSSFEGEYLGAARANLRQCSEALQRMEDGITTLRTDETAWRAFAMANAAMNRQSNFPSKGKRRGDLVWRPFQLAFMLLVLPGIVDPAKKDRDCMDLLWFPTGGGKTEAYLAITAFQIFLRRLKDTRRRGEGGVDVIMRYTLRLLTVQQFQRAAALITACEMMRRQDRSLGSASISLGLYVGGEATPNRIEDARDALEKEHAGESPKSTPRQLLRCPVCGDELQSASYRADPEAPRIDITCSTKGCETAGTPLPVLTVDDTLYATPPSLLIGTIDKFAQIPRRTDMRRLFGLDGGLRPGLIIQDELHLISGPLGSMTGLYETVVDILCTDSGVRPKIIGSTATIGQAARQVTALFDRSVLQFPPPGFDADDSFFAVRDTGGPDRLYVGLSNAGRSPKFALQAAVAALLQSAQVMRLTPDVAPKDVDPYWTCVAYFNSLRELGGAYVLMQDDVPRQMQFLATRTGIALRPLEMPPVELSSRVSSRELPKTLQSLEAPLAEDDDPYADPPKDSVLASNMLSVGVDVPRLGLMVVNGQPKSTAEYIQASSRVGRGMPGLVFTLYNASRPRDLSHFEHFRGYHGALYRRVEASSVTPWAPRARDKALHAVIVAAVRHAVPGLSGDDDAILFDARTAEITSLTDSIIGRIDRGSEGVETADAAVQLREIVGRWAARASEAKPAGTKLKYWEKKAPFGRTAPHLMFAAEEGRAPGALAWPTPNTMRDVEPSTAFVLKKIARKQENKDADNV